MNTRGYLILLCCIIANSVIGQITINITSLPEHTPEDAAIYFASNINQWSPDAKGFEFKKEDGQYVLSFTPKVEDVIEFKCTRGTWAAVEAGENGAAISNRAIVYEGSPIVYDVVIESWEDLDGQPVEHSYSDNVSILSDEFFIPQLNRKRRVWIYLPPNYHTSSQKYPVMYMHDGQNVFDVKTSYAGEWEVDEALDRLYKDGGGCIIVAVDNGQEFRQDEYSPWKNPTYGGGQGKEYVRFIVETLKPHIDSNYRTIPDREHTGIMGSSMGGIISLYAGLEYPEVFSKLGVFSPAFWFSDECYQHVLEQTKRMDAKIFLLIGRLEGKRYVHGMSAMYHVLKNVGFEEDEIFYKVDEKGQHQEKFWADQFPSAFEWLMGIGGNAKESVLPTLTVTASKDIRIQSHKDLGPLEVIVKKKKNGKVNYSDKGNSVLIPSKYWKNKKYDIQVLNENDILIQEY